MFKDNAKEILIKYPIIFFFGLTLAGGTIYYARSTFAFADDLYESNKKIDELKQLTLESFKKQELRAIKKEIYALERLVESGAATERDIKRLDDLKNERDDIERELKED
jgi:hypothetical protein